MTTYELIQILNEMDPDAEVKLAVQPSWPFQHSIGEVVEIIPTSDGCTWGVEVSFDDGDKEFEEAEINSQDGARDYEYKVREYSGHGVKITATERGVLIEGSFVPEDEYLEFCEDETPIVYIGEGGQDCYLPGEAKNKLGW